MRRCERILMLSWWIPHPRVMVVLVHLHMLMLASPMVHVLVAGLQPLMTMNIWRHYVSDAVAPRLLLSGLWRVEVVGYHQSRESLCLALLRLLRRSGSLGCCFVRVPRLLGVYFFSFFEL